MSVQAGIWNFDGRPVDCKLLATFSETLKQQGPDGESCFVNGSVALLYRPFHTTIESRLEKQPYRSPLSYVFTWDGRLDNRDELIIKLHNITDDLSDVAIVAAAFERWGTDCFQHLIGDWAVSIWKPLERELLFACDYMCIRHIFYYLKEDRISWSTDLTPLILLVGEKFHIDDDYIAGYFANDPGAHLTPYREIHQVPPGQFVRIRNGMAQVERFWRFKPKSCISYKSDAEYEEHFGQLFRESVRRRLRSDSPILAELSGGLDSSSIVCMADDIIAKEGTLTPHLDTLSYYDNTEPNGDDSIYFPKIEEKRGRVGFHIDASKLGLAPAPLEYSDFAPLPGHLGSGRQLEAERANVIRSGRYRAVLSGIGGDEFMGGVPNPSAQLADLIVRLRISTLAKQLIAWSLVKKRPWPHLLWQALSHLAPPVLAQYMIKQAKVEAWIAKGFAKRTRLAIRQLDVEEHFGLWLPTRRSYIGGVLMMANKLAKTTAQRLAPEEVRYPYLDQNLIQFLLSIPAIQLLRPGERRSLMRRALVGIVPEEILSRRTKQVGVRTPVVALGKNWETLQIVFRSPLSSSLGYVDQIKVAEALQAAQAGQSVHTVRLLRTVSLEIWLRDLASHHLIDPETAPPSTRSRGPYRRTRDHKRPVSFTPTQGMLE